jgi:hypothetical protein
MRDLFAGALTLGFTVIGMFFLRFWRETRDRLFLLFALSFFLSALNRLLLGLTGGVEGSWQYFHWVRLLSFLVILLAIVDKNRSPT